MIVQPESTYKPGAWIAVGERKYPGEGLAVISDLLQLRKPKVVVVGFDENFEKTMWHYLRKEVKLVIVPSMNSMPDYERKLWTEKVLLEYARSYQEDGYRVTAVGFLNYNSKRVWSFMRAASAECLHWQAWSMQGRKAKGFPEWV